jgi:hypothetical protein
MADRLNRPTYPGPPPRPPLEVRVHELEQTVSLLVQQLEDLKRVVARGPDPRLLRGR